MDTSIHFLKSLMDVTTARHEVLANNLANVDTPGYCRKDLLFKDAMQQALESGKSNEFKNLGAELVDDYSQPSRPDGNNVSTQLELGEISQNELLYRVATHAMSHKISRLKKVINSGGQ